MWSTSQPKFIPKKPVAKVSGRKIVATMVRRLGHLVDEHVDGLGEQLAQVVDLVGGDHEVVVDVAERVARDVALEAGQVLEQSPPRASMSRCGIDDLLQAEELGAQLAHAPAVGRLGAHEGDLLEVLDLGRVAVGERAQRVGQRVEDAVDEVLLGAHVRRGGALAGLPQVRARGAADGDDLLAGDVDVDLDELGARARRRRRSSTRSP